MFHSVFFLQFAKLYSCGCLWSVIIWLPFQILDGLCRQTGSFSKNCLALVDEYYEPLYNLLMSEIRPKQICESVGLCGESSVFKQQVRTAVKKYVVNGYRLMIKHDPPPFITVFYYQAYCSGLFYLFMSSHSLLYGLYWKHSSQLCPRSLSSLLSLFNMSLATGWLARMKHISQMLCFRLLSSPQSLLRVSLAAGWLARMKLLPSTMKTKEIRDYIWPVFLWVALELVNISEICCVFNTWITYFKDTVFNCLSQWKVAAFNKKFSDLNERCI